MGHQLAQGATRCLRASDVFFGAGKLGVETDSVFAELFGARPRVSCAGASTQLERLGKVVCDGLDFVISIPPDSNHTQPYSQSLSTGRVKPDPPRRGCLAVPVLRAQHLLARYGM